MNNEKRIEYLTNQNNQLSSKLIRLNGLNDIIYCNQCKTYFEELEGSVQPDYEGHCPMCGERSNWEVMQILDGKKDIIELLNSGDLDL